MLWPGRCGTIARMTATNENPAVRAGRTRWMDLLVLLCLAALICAMAAGSGLQAAHRELRRGVSTTRLPAAAMPPGQGYGVNVALEQYSADELPQVLELVQRAGLYWLRQSVPWSEIEPSQGDYHWEPWDRIVDAVQRQGLGLVAVLETSPAWARRPADRAERSAPPQYPTTFALFARAIASRYAGRIAWYQVWDQPNIAPNWGSGPVDPQGYVRLLRLAAAEIRAADPAARIQCAALAPNTESGGRNMSDVLFLRGIYQSGGKGWFDALAAKPYGFWSGPDDRRVNANVLNFSRLILLREELVRFDDADVPIWAAEFGWNSLPPGWEGQPSPWGTDEPALQTARSVLAVRRARSEWGWLGPMIWAQLQPTQPDSAGWGLALLGRDSQPTAFYDALSAVTGEATPLTPPDESAFLARAAAVLLLGLVSVAGLAVAWRQSDWPRRLRRMAAAFAGAPAAVQLLLLALSLAVFWFSPWSWVSLGGLVVAAWAIWQRTDLGLCAVVATLPFYGSWRAVLGRQVSVVELLLLLSLGSFLGGLLRGLPGKAARPTLRELCRWLVGQVRPLTALDWATVGFVVLAAASLAVSQNKGVSLREFRVIVLEPALFYWMIRMGVRERAVLRRLAISLLVAGLAVSLYGLYQYVAHGDAIVVEGVRRMRAVYGSPNNLSLFLGRVIPLALAIALAGTTHWLRRASAVVLAVLVLCFFLTFSRGGWLLSLPAGFLTVAFLRGRRTTLMVLGALLLCLALLLPIAGTERLTSLLDLEQGTTFRRIGLWRAAWRMISDHPITGVGLDNFLYRYPDYMLPEAWEEPNLSHPHNIVLDFWTRLGIGGPVVLAVLLLAFFQAALRLYWRLPEGDEHAIILGWTASMVATLAHGMVDHSYFLVDLALVFFLTLGWVSALPLAMRAEAPLEAKSG